MSVEYDIILTAHASDLHTLVCDVRRWLELHQTRGWEFQEREGFYLPDVAIGRVNHLDVAALTAFVRERAQRVCYTERVQLFVRCEMDDIEQGFRDVLTPRKADGFPEVTSG